MLLFCKSETLDHFGTNFALTPQTLGKLMRHFIGCPPNLSGLQSHRKWVTAAAGESAKEKTEDRYSNLIASSLLALRYFIGDDLSLYRTPPHSYRVCVLGCGHQRQSPIPRTVHWLIADTLNCWTKNFGTSSKIRSMCLSVGLHTSC